MKKNEKEQLMKKHGITREVKYTYRYKNHKYPSLEQAVNFAVAEQETNEEVEEDTIYWDTTKEL